MRLRRWIGVGLGLAVAMFTRDSRGQRTPYPMELPPPVSSTLPHQAAVNAPPVLGQPFSAIRTNDTLRILGDGTRIEHHTATLYRRDSAGRTRTDTTPEPLPGNKSAGEVIYTTIFDPVTGTTLYWSNRTKEAILRQRSQAGRVATGEGKPLDNKPRTVWIGPAGQKQRMEAIELPPRVIEGMTTRGSRVVKRVPAGREGNDRDLVTTIDSWYSPELKLALLTEITDPYMGKTTYAFTGLSREEPNPSLFKVPPGYVIKDMTLPDAPPK